MLASELILQLTKLIEKNGDLPVFHWDDWDEFSVDEVNIVEEYSDSTYESPKHILLGRDIHGFGTRIGEREMNELERRNVTDDSEKRYFNWTRTYGCNCNRLDNKCEKYILNIGHIYGGIVESHLGKYSNEIYWSWYFTVAGNNITSAEGGDLTRDKCFEEVEKHIIQSIKDISLVNEYYYLKDNRRIYDGQIVVDKQNGEWYQERLE